MAAECFIGVEKEGGSEQLGTGVEVDTRDNVAHNEADFIEQLWKAVRVSETDPRGEKIERGRWTDLTEPSVNNAQVVVVMFGALGELVDLCFVQVSLTLVLAHLTENSIFLVCLQGRRSARGRTRRGRNRHESGRGARGGEGRRGEERGGKRKRGEEGKGWLVA